MSEDPGDRPRLRLELVNREAIFTALVSVAAALRYAMEIAICPERLHVDDQASRLDALTQELLRKAKNVSTEFVAEPDDAAGVVAAIAIINESAQVVGESTHE